MRIKTCNEYVFILNQTFKGQCILQELNYS